MASIVEVGCESGTNPVSSLFEAIKEKGTQVDPSAIYTTNSLPNYYTIFAIRINDSYYYCGGSGYYNSSGTYTCGLVTASYIMSNIGAGNIGYQIYLKMYRSGNSSVYSLYVADNDSFSRTITLAQFAQNVEIFEMYYISAFDYNQLMLQLGGGIIFFPFISFAA